MVCLYVYYYILSMAGLGMCVMFAMQMISYRYEWLEVFRAQWILYTVCSAWLTQIVSKIPDDCQRSDGCRVYN